jgi:hypothetical protein
MASGLSFDSQGSKETVIHNLILVMFARWAVFPPKIWAQSAQLQTKTM